MSVNEQVKTETRRVCGRERFAFGALRYTGPATVPFGDRLAAIPLQGLWTGTSLSCD